MQYQASLDKSHVCDSSPTFALFMDDYFSHCKFFLVMWKNDYCRESTILDITGIEFNHWSILNQPLIKTIHQPCESSAILHCLGWTINHKSKLNQTINSMVDGSILTKQSQPLNHQPLALPGLRSGPPPAGKALVSLEKSHGAGSTRRSAGASQPWGTGRSAARSSWESYRAPWWPLAELLRRHRLQAVGCIGQGTPTSTRRSILNWVIRVAGWWV